MRLDRGLGATKLGTNDWSFLVWAPRHDALAVRVVSGPGAGRYDLDAWPNGYFASDVPGLGDEPEYWYETAAGQRLADPVSRSQPGGIHGPSRAVDLDSFEWTDGLYQSPPLAETVLYELHIGTFTAAGTFAAAIEHLDELIDLGVTAVEPMPIAAFPGARNWGYDGVFPYAVQESYGGPRGFAQFVDACHARGLAVYLDVVYNHLGPEGNVLAEFAPYFTDVYATPWGSAVNVSEAGSDEVRRYFSDNALMWLRDFHVDGLRLDAIHGIVDPTASPFLRELTTAGAGLAAEQGRRLTLIAESADNNPAVVSSSDVGGLGFDAQWNDDFHHALHAHLTGERDGYYADYGTVGDVARAMADGFVFEGQHSVFRGRRHGASSRGIRPDHFVVFGQNHDQIGNRAGAERLTTLLDPAAVRLATASVLLSPYVPLLFMGEEYAETAPFPYFIDHGDAALVEAVRRGRASEFGRDADAFDPASEATYDQARLGRDRRTSDAGRAALALHRRLLAVRREHPVLTDPDPLDSEVVVNGDVITSARRSGSGSVFVAMNFAAEARHAFADLAAPRWMRVLDSGDPDLGGGGDRTPDYLDAAGQFTLSGYGFSLYVATTVEDGA